MQRELDALQSAEEALASMRKRLSEAEEFKQTVLQEKNLLELKLKLQDRKSKELEAAHRARKESLEQYGANSREVINQLHDEILQLSNSLKQAEIQLEAAQISSSELQFWLQLTYEFELEHFNAKKRLAEAQFQQVKESCEKIRKRRNAFLGSMRIAHGDILSTVDERIAEARKTLEDVISDASERTVRWSYIQRACGLEIVVNPGLQALQAQERTRLANANASTAPSAPIPLSAASASNNGNSLSDTTSIYGLRSMQSSSGISASFSTSPSNGNLSGAGGLSTLARRSAPVDENYSGLWMSAGIGRATGVRHDEDDAAGTQRARLLDCTLRPAKMRNELDSLILDAAGAFAKPVMQHRVLAARASHEIPTVTDQRLAAARKFTVAGVHKINGHFDNDAPSLHYAAHTASDESLTNSDNTIKPWVFHWRAKTKLAQLRRRSPDKFVRTVDASS